jgi:hypothetical protein
VSEYIFGRKRGRHGYDMPRPKSEVEVNTMQTGECKGRGAVRVAERDEAFIQGGQDMRANALPICSTFSYRTKLDLHRYGKLG